MSVHNLSPSRPRSRSALDHRAIDMAGQFLAAGIWLELQLASVPIRTVWAAESGTSGQATKASRFQSFTPHPLLREER
jgi:hypothetical protein